LRWGRRLGELFERPGGERFRARLQALSNAEYHALLRPTASSVRTALVKSAGGKTDRTLDGLLGEIPDDALHELIADVGGHDLSSVLEAFTEAERSSEQPCVIIADTIKGWRLPFAGDPMNHGALLTGAQLEELRAALGIAPGDEWAGFASGSPEAALIARSPRPAAESVPIAQSRAHSAPIAQSAAEASPIAQSGPEAVPIAQSAAQSAPVARSAVDAAFANRMP